MRINPFQEEGNDERKVEIERVNDEILKIMQASVVGEFGFYKESVTSKLASNRPKRKPIWTTMGHFRCLLESIYCNFVIFEFYYVY